jgi:hypothetical protein
MAPPLTTSALPCNPAALVVEVGSTLPLEWHHKLHGFKVNGYKNPADTPQGMLVCRADTFRRRWALANVSPALLNFTKTTFRKSQVPRASRVDLRHINESQRHADTVRCATSLSSERFRSVDSHGNTLTAEPGQTYSGKASTGIAGMSGPTRGPTT